MPREPIARPPRFTNCYGCGHDNKRGLALDFFRDGASVVADFTPAPEHGGYGRVLHGGVTATAIDEAFGWTIYGLLGKLGMTTEMSVKFLAPLYCGVTLTVRGVLEKHDDDAATIRVQIHDPRGNLGAEGVGQLRFVSARLVERLGDFKGT